MVVDYHYQVAYSMYRNTELINYQRFQHISKKLSQYLDRIQPPEDVVFMVTALVVGITTGIGAIIFRYLIQAVEWVGYSWIPMVMSQWGNAYVVIVPAVGGLMVGLLVYFFAREAKGHGVPEVMEAVALRGGRIRPMVAGVKALASAICIGSGGSAGREGPIVQIGSALGSTIGQILKLSDERVSNLVACGAAGGIAATFNAPIAGVVFALEVILGGRFGVRYVSSVVIAAVTASVIGRAAFGNVAAFKIPFEYGIRSLWEFLLYVILGVLAAFVGVLFTRTLYGMEDLFDNWKRPPEWFKPAVGGALLGILALAYPFVTHVSWDHIPHVYNVGYDVIESVLSNQLTLSVALLLLVLKLVATSLTLGSGGSGGVFAPSLFMGAMLGAAFAMAVQPFLPGQMAPAGAYALVGMAAVFSAAAHAPVTAILILFELTGDYRIILPLMLAVVISTLVARYLLSNESIYTLKLSRRGVRLQGGRDVDVMDAVVVQEVMDLNPPTIAGSSTLDELRSYLLGSHHHGVMVLNDENQLIGVVTLQDLEYAMQTSDWMKMSVREIMSSPPLTAYPDETIGSVLKRMMPRDVGRLPVVERDDPGVLLGLVRRADIARAYQVGILRRETMLDKANQMRISRNAGGTEFVELYVEKGSIADGSQVLALDLPEECLLTTRRHRDRMKLLHGQDRLEMGDQVLALCDPDKVEALRKLFAKPDDV